MVGMDYLTAPLSAKLAKAFDWSRVRSFVDVGGGRGTVAATVAAAHPHLQGGVFDLPPVRPVFEEHVAGTDLGERISFHGGNFFTDNLPSVDVLMFGHVLHDWGVAERRALLAAAFRALPPGGRVLIYDPMIDDDRSHRASSLLVSLNMLLATPGGSEYTAAECFEWLAQAGFGEPDVVALDDHDSLVTARKPLNL
jgi:ubiquinone/menaquinone biosynthesis C-methylase UbiE